MQRIKTTCCPPTLRPIRSFLDIDIARNWNLIALNQGAYIDRLVGEFKLTDAKITTTPLDHSLPMLPAAPHDSMCNPELYQHFTGSINHLLVAVFTRPDISFADAKLAQFNANPTATHFSAAIHVLRYLKGTRNGCIV